MRIAREEIRAQPEGETIKKEFHRLIVPFHAGVLYGIGYSGQKKMRIAALVIRIFGGATRSRSSQPPPY